MAFEPITTQEAFDAAIGERIKREKEIADKKIKELEASISVKESEHTATITSLQNEIKDKDGKIATFETEKKELTNKISGYESNSAKMRIAHEAGLPYELASKIEGADEEAMKKDAESLKKLMGAGSPPPPLSDPEQSAGDEKEAEFKSLLNNLKGDE